MTRPARGPTTVSGTVGPGSRGLAGCVELDQLERHLADRSPHPPPRLLPLTGAEAGERRVDAAA